MRQARWIASAWAVLELIAQPVAAADAADRYPSKPIRIVVGSTPGATPDILARLIGAKLGESWKQPVVIENRVPGVIGYNAVAKSTPDGYTLLLASPALPIRAVVSSNLPYDTLRDFTGVTEIGYSNVPVAADAVPGWKPMGAQSVVVRSGRPMAIRQKLSKEVGRILALPDVREKLSAVAFHITPSNPEAHDKKLRADIEAFAAIVKEIGLQVN